MDIELQRAALFFENAADHGDDFEFSVFHEYGDAWLKINDRLFRAVSWRGFDAEQLAIAMDVWVFDECNKIGRQDIADRYRRIKQP